MYLILKRISWRESLHLRLNRRFFYNCIYLTLIIREKTCMIFTISGIWIWASRDTCWNLGNGENFILRGQPHDPPHPHLWSHFFGWIFRPRFMYKKDNKIFLCHNTSSFITAHSQNYSSFLTFHKSIFYIYIIYIYIHIIRRTFLNFNI